MSRRFDEPAVTTAEKPGLGREGAICVCGELAIDCWFDTFDINRRVQQISDTVVYERELPMHLRLDAKEETAQETLTSVLVAHANGELPERVSDGWLAQTARWRLIDLGRASNPDIAYAIKKHSGDSDKVLEKIVEDAKGSSNLTTINLGRRAGNVLRHRRGQGGVHNVSLDRFADTDDDVGSLKLYNSIIAVKDHELFVLDDILECIVEPVFQHRISRRVTGSQPNYENIRHILMMMLRGEKSNEEIATGMGFTASRVSQTLKQFSEWARELADIDPDYAHTLGELAGRQLSRD